LPLPITSPSGAVFQDDGVANLRSAASIEARIIATGGKEQFESRDHAETLSR